MDADSIDACVTDTPYGLSTILDPPNLDRESLWQKLTSGAKESPIKTLMRAWLDTGENPVMKGRGFMGKEWDALVPPPNTWRAVWRVLKPGAYCLAFGGTRTYALIEMSLRFADFEIEDTISWLYGQGFPKRVRLDLKIDQHHGKVGERPVVGSKLGQPGYHLHPHAGGATYGDGVGRTTAEQRLKASQEFGPATHDAARFVGWDRALRPGWEPIIVAVKPLRGTVAENALAHGTGGLHVDACRLPRGDAGELVATKGKSTRGSSTVLSGHGDGHGQDVFIDPRGGYPANVAMDEEVATMLDEQSGPCRGAAPASGPTHEGAARSVAHGERRGNGDAPAKFHGRADGASRFFYVAKASSSERDAGLDGMPPLTAGERCGREDGSAGITGYAGTQGEGGRNPHPTVKPVALMRWLCRLTSPPGAGDPDLERRPVVLDPFAGSGSTGVACMAEGVRFVGCELDPAMADVMRRRLQHAYALPPDDAEAPARRDDAPGQRTLF
jgi:site-specific DNA-methyltransferase (adenine-specific)